MVQRRRIDDSGLGPLVDGVCIVEEKDSAVFEAALVEMDAEASASWSVGNSYGSDIHPSGRAGPA
jgi:FMN phosphatase YigB (HAD superfamily)